MSTNSNRTNSTSKTNALHQELPPKLFYWGLLDTSILTTNRNPTPTPSPTQLDHLLDGTLPLAVEELQTTYLKIQPNQYLACGIERAALDRFIEEYPHAITLTPQSLPQAISTQISVNTIDITAINLLINDYEPTPVRTQRKRVFNHAAAAILFCGILLVLGLENRRAQYHATHTNINQAQTTIYESILGKTNTSSNPNTQPPAARFIGELRKLQQTRRIPQFNSSSSTGQTSAVADQTLHRLLSHWPTDQETLHLQTEHISITADTLTIVGLLPTLDAAQTFTTHIQAFDPANWQAKQPTIVNTSQNAAVRFTQRFQRQRNAPLASAKREDEATP